MSSAYERLLSTYFTPEQQAEFAYYGWVTVVGGKTGTRYVLSPGISPLVLGKGGIISHELCVYAKICPSRYVDTETLFPSVVTLKNWIEHQETAFLMTARCRAVFCRRSLRQTKLKLIRLTVEEIRRAN